MHFRDAVRRLAGCGCFSVGVNVAEPVEKAVAGQRRRLLTAVGTNLHVPNDRLGVGFVQFTETKRVQGFVGWMGGEFR